MIVLEGTPGAGKTTLLGSIVEHHHHRVIVFPEAQPEAGVNDEFAIATGLLEEDLDRVRWAERLEGFGRLSVLSDRCYIGVLAYRHALWQTGKLDKSHFVRAREYCLKLGLRDRHRRSRVFIFITSPAVSIQRRSRYSAIAEHAVWFDSDFLEAYNSYLEGSHSEFPDDIVYVKNMEPLMDLLLRRANDGEPCGTCGSEPRSTVVPAHDTMVQLYARGLHIRHQDKEVCVDTARQAVDMLGLADDRPSVLHGERE
ncbi:AAA family ATPase [Nonomuraea rhodomycinica]|uniref:AAA family ATPase n=1 Tax=Nonomuraea rhodomycinica TaxID=1712872 RepID=A0A7Y6II69_9ACTN|nr:AAA family ATPase [Nonomuraea rhodomycinica]NUW38685.1 AAA family ATPase [Nonomuraea rhodomycinica]